MKHLLSKQSLRMLEMVTYLYHHDWVTLEKISEAIGYSERTLREDIKYLNSIISPIDIMASTKLGVKLEIPQGYSLKYVHSVLLSDSLNFNVLEAAFLHDYQDVGALADALYSSPSVISKAITQLNKGLKSLQFRLTTNPVRIVGDEKWITAYFRSYFLAKYDKHLPFGQEFVEPVQVAINQMYKEEKAVILPMNRNLLVLYGVIRVFRMSRSPENYYRRSARQEVYRQSIIDYNQTLSKIAGLSETYDFFRDIWRATDEDMTCFRMDEFQQFVVEKESVRQVYQIYEALATQLEAELGFHFKFKEWFIFNLYNIANGEKYEVSILTDKTEYLLPNMKKLVPFIYLTVSRIAEVYAPQLQLAPTKLLYNIFSSTDDFLTTGYAKQPKLKVAVYSKFNNITVANNWNVIKNTFANQFDVSLIQSTFEDTRQQINQEYDLLVTDVNNIDIDIDYFCISYDISDKELEQLEDYYFKAMMSQVEAKHADVNE